MCTRSESNRLWCYPSAPNAPTFPLGHVYNASASIRKVPFKTAIQTITGLNNSSLRGVGIEPTRISTEDLKTSALTTRPSSLVSEYLPLPQYIQSKVL